MDLTEEGLINENLMDNSNDTSSSGGSSTNTSVLSRTYAAQAQALSEEKLKVLNCELHAKELARDSGLVGAGIQKEINVLRERIKKEENNLRSKIIICFDKKNFDLH